MKYIFLLFYIAYFTSCGGLYSDDDDRRRRDRDRQGRYDDDGLYEDPCSSLYSIPAQASNSDDDDDIPVRLPTELQESSFFDLNCSDNQQGPPLTLTDIISSSLFNVNTFDRQARSCVSQKLEQANNCLCSTRDKLENQRRRYHDDNNFTEATRVEYSLSQLKKIEQRFRTNLNKIRDRAQGQSNRKIVKSNFLNFFITDQLYGWEIVFDTEAHIRCQPAYNNDDRGYNRGGGRSDRTSRNGNDRYNSRTQRGYIGDRNNY